LDRQKSLSNNPPTQSIVEKLPIGEDIKAALCGDENELKQFLVLIRAFESANWQGVATISKQLSLDLKMTQSFYNESLKWCIVMRQSVSG
jgi:c-di-GMP-related signal transduction protein